MNLIPTAMVHLLVILALASEVFRVQILTADAFNPTLQQISSNRLSHPLSTRQRKPIPSMIVLHQSNNNNSFDMSKPTFDIFTLRSIRSDALLRYNSLNQSEPLRINLYMFFTLGLFAYPSISEAVVGEPASLFPGVVLSVAGGAFSAFRFVRECGFRSNKLNRIEKEMNAQLLSVQFPSAASRFSSDRVTYDAPISLGRLQASGLRSRRIIALCGTASQLKDALLMFRVLRNRLAQSKSAVVVIPTDGSSEEDWGFDGLELRNSLYLAKPENLEQWKEYFQSLASNDNDATSSEKLTWLGLTNTGKSFGSGVGEPPKLLEVFGQNLLPFDILDEEDSDDASITDDKKRNVLASQKAFYSALTTGDLDAMTGNIYETGFVRDVDEVIENGGRIDGWESCLAAGARPANMKISGSDVLLISDTEAYSTTIEFPEPGDGFARGTLLALQRWKRLKDGDDWKLELHQTIPWSPESKAGGLLMCDCRGCVALTRGPDRSWSFRGMID